MFEKCIITAAVTGGDIVPSQSPYLPITPQEIADEAVRSAEAGAAVVHVHARDPKTGEPSSDPAIFGEIMGSIKSRCDAVICPTTGGNPRMTFEERFRIVPMFKPEMATMNMGTMNYTLHFIAESYERRNKKYKFDWEEPYLKSTKDAVFKNTFASLEYLFGLMKENQVKPECEVYDLGMIYNAAFLHKAGVIDLPMQIQYVLGVVGGVNAEIGVLQYLKGVTDQQFGTENYTWSVIGAGYPQEFDMAAMAVLMGGNVRVGMEDNFRLNKDTYATSNAQLVEKTVKIVEALDREVATPEDARRILGLKGKDQVGF